MGLNYGIANVIGKPSEAKAVELIDTALANGIDTFDTAQAYGDSEKVVGRVLKNLKVGGKVKVITKISPDLDIKNAGAIQNSVDSSLASIGTEKLHCLMLHRAEMIPAMDQTLGKVLKHCCLQGKVEHLGVSVYKVEEAEAALQHEDLDYIQVPANIWDQRMVDAGVFESAARKGKTIFVRSIFLQGLLVMSPAEVAEKLPFAYEAALEWHRLADELGFSKQWLALAGGKKLACPLVIGSESPEQIRENAEMFSNAGLTDTVFADINRRMQPFLNEKILNPSQWKQI